MDDTYSIEDLIKFANYQLNLQGIIGNPVKEKDVYQWQENKTDLGCDCTGIDCVYPHCKN